jgi:hypothetical protein
MLTKLCVILLVFSISICAHSAPTSADCVASLEIPNGAADNQNLCSRVNAKETTTAKNQQRYSENEVFTHIRLSKRQPSLAESLMAIFFIPGLILLWFSRFTKSNK